MTSDARVRLEVVAAGDEIVVPVMDGIGFTRITAPVDGFQVHFADTVAFVSWEDLQRLRKRK